jgi:hypothetical protein
MDRMPTDHVYYVKLTANDNVKPCIKVGDTFRDATTADLEWKANDSVTFKPDDGFDVVIDFVVKTSAGVFVTDAQPPLGVTPVTDALGRNVPMQAQQGGKTFRFRCTLINIKTHQKFGWGATQNAASGSADGDVHD